MAQALVALLHKWHSGKLPELQIILLQESVVPTLLQCLVQVLRSQHPDGSWGGKGPREETAYALLALIELSDFGPAQLYYGNIMGAIDRGRVFLRQPGVRTAEYLWIEKVTYGSENLSEAYIIAALYASPRRLSLSQATLPLSDIPSPQIAEFASVTETEPFSSDPACSAIACWITARLYVPVLPKTPSGLSFATYGETAFRWILAGKRNTCVASPRLLMNRMLASLLTNKVIALLDASISAENINQIIWLKTGINQAVKTPDRSRRTTMPLGPNEAYERDLPRTTTEVETQPNGDCSEKNYPMLCNTISISPSEASPSFRADFSLIDSFERRESSAHTRENHERVLRLQLERFILACLSRLDAQGYRPRFFHDECTTEHILGLLSPKSQPTNLPVLSAFAAYLRSRNDAFLTITQQ